jgi:hypothetical protein
VRVGLAWVAAGADGLRAIDVSDPSSPVQLTLVPSLPGAVWEVEVAGSRVYAAESGAPNPTGGGILRVIEVTDPHAPLLLGSLHASWSVANDIEVTGEVVYWASSTFVSEVFPYHDGSVAAIDVSNPARPAELGSFEDLCCPTGHDALRRLGLHLRRGPAAPPPRLRPRVRTRLRSDPDDRGSGREAR